MGTNVGGMTPFVKICGVRGGRDVATALEHGANAIGVVLTPSPRQITTTEAHAVVRQVAGRALVVGVFHGENIEQVRKAALESGIGVIQLHGKHPREDFYALRDLGLPLIRAVAADAPDLAVGAYGEELLIVDAPKPGSGETWDYRPLRGQLGGNWILAGGLTPDNVARALEESGAAGVDVSSGVEAERGIKDEKKIAAFLLAARAKNV